MWSPTAGSLTPENRQPVSKPTHSLSNFTTAPLRANVAVLPVLNHFQFDAGP